jgi:hypothetical protein
MDSATNWVDSEPVLSETATRVTTRLLQRSRRSWPVWVGSIFVLCSYFAVQKIRHPAIIPAVVVIRLVEGSLELSRTPISTRLIRAKIFDLAFTRPNLLALLRRHRAAFPRLAIDPTVATDDLLADVFVIVSQNDFLQYREPGDPPRSVKITVSYKHVDAEVAMTVARELADLVVKAEVREEQTDLKLQAAASSEAQAQGADILRSLLADGMQLTEGTQPPGGGPAKPPGILSSVSRRLDETARRDATNQLMLRAMDENQGLHLELIDPGRAPVRVKGLAAAQGILMGFPLILLIVALAVGAFDPRVLDDQDLRALGIAPLGHARARRGRV